MRTSVSLDETLLNRAQDLSGVQEQSALLKEALSALIKSVNIANTATKKRLKFMACSVMEMPNVKLEGRGNSRRSRLLERPSRSVC